MSMGDGILKLHANKEKRGGQEWTSASMWTKEKYQYGYFQCRYKNAKAKGTNHSFWLMTQGIPNEKLGRFEIDINEGHDPNRINMNIHNWSGNHWSKSKHKIIEGADLAQTYHVCGLEWNRQELIWYYDGKEIRREKNSICHGPSPVWLSLAIILWGGQLTAAIDGTSMGVDYVRVHQKGETIDKPEGAATAKSWWLARIFLHPTFFF